jgi:hypothetical protein
MTTNTKLLTTTSEMVAAALKLAETYDVFPAPINEKKSHKAKRFSNGRNWGMTRDKDEIRADWERWPDACVGVPCGPANDLWVMETDTRAGGHAYDGEETLAGIVAQHGGLPETRKARSPSGSIHYWFKWPTDGGDPITNTVGATDKKGVQSGIGNGIDTRGEGGMVVAPPSNRKTEKIVGVYEWLNDDPVLPAPDWLVAMARAASRKDRKKRSEAATRDSGATHCDLERLESAVRVLANPDLDWEAWNKVIMAIYAATNGSSPGKKIAREWSAKSSKHADAGFDEKWDKKLGESPPTETGAGYIFARVYEQDPNWERISVNDFYAHMPSGKFLFVPTLEHWPAESVAGRLPPIEITEQARDKYGHPKVDADGNPMMKVVQVKAPNWLKQNRAIEQETWSPGLPMVIENKVFTREGVWVDRPGARSFNLYKAPTLIPGDARLAGKWLDLVDRVVGANRRHVVSWFAHAYQRPGEKINHALVLGGSPGIGKDSMIAPLRRAIGPNNFTETKPQNLLRPYNRFLQADVLRVNEALDLGEMNRFQFYNTLKDYIVTPPEHLNIEEKYLPAYPIVNVVGLIITTNYKDALFLPSDDRRVHVSWSDARIEDVVDGYFNEYYAWLNAGGDGHVATYLRDFDLSRFDPKAPPPKTDAFWEMVQASAPTEMNDVANVIERLPPLGLGSPDAFSTVEFKNAIPLEGDFRKWAEKEKNAFLLPKRFADAGYVVVKNPDDKRDGFWRIAGSRTSIYVKESLSSRERIKAVRDHIERANELIADAVDAEAAIVHANRLAAEGKVADAEKMIAAAETMIANSKRLVAEKKAARRGTNGRPPA